MPASTPIYGFRYPLDTDPVPVMPSDMESLAEDVEATFDLSTGGKKIVPTATGHTNITFDARGNGTPSTGVSTFTINNVFTTQFNMYRLHWLGASVSGGTPIGRLSYPSVTSGYYGGVIYNRPNAITPSAFAMDNNNTLHSEITFGTSNGVLYSVTIYNPAQSGVQTAIVSPRLEMNTTMASSALGTYVGFVSSTASINSVTVTVSGATFNPVGRVTIYGFTV